MAHYAPNKHDRDGISIVKLLEMLPNDETARTWFESKIRTGGPHCPHCRSLSVLSGIKDFNRYVTEFAKRHNVRESGTFEQMGALATVIVGKWQRYRELVA